MFLGFQPVELMPTFWCRHLKHGSINTEQHLNTLNIDGPQ